MVMLKRYTLDELANEVNKRLEENKYIGKSSDGRVSDIVTPRKITDWMSKDMIGSPLKEGRKNYFDDSHVTQILGIKELQKEGVGEKMLKNMISTSYMSSNAVNDTSEASASIAQFDALSVLEAIKARTMMPTNNHNVQPANFMIGGSLSPRAVGSLGRSVGSELLEKSSVMKKSLEYVESQKHNIKVFSEIPLDNTGKLYLKMEQNYNPVNKEEILEKIKQILGIGE